MPRRKRLTSVAQAQALAQRRLPRSVYSFIEGGTGAEYTVHDNLAAFREITFRPRAATAFESRRLATTVLGDDLSMPVIVAPTGLIRIAHRGGEVAAARAAGVAGTAIGARTEVLMDGGVRRGADVVKAIALGARAVLIGRAWVWALAADGEDGVLDILTMFRSDIDRTLALLGCSGVDALDPSYLDVPVGWAPGGR